MSKGGARPNSGRKLAYEEYGQTQPTYPFNVPGDISKEEMKAVVKKLLEEKQKSEE